MKLTLIVTSLVLVTTSQATLFFNSTNNANGAAERNLWLTAAGITSPDILVDFENFAFNQDMNNVAHAGSLVTRNSGAGLMDIRGAGAFGSSNPIDTKGMWHDESQSIVLDFTSGPVSYVGGWDIDTGSWSITATFDNNETQVFSLDTTATSGNSAEFWGLVVNDGRKITKLELDGSGSGGWGVDNIEYNDVVPEPATMTILGLAAIAAAKKRKRK